MQRGVMKLPYGRTTIECFPPESIEWQLLLQNLPPVTQETDEIIQRGIQKLSEQIKAGGFSTAKHILIVIPDHTRRCHAERILPGLLDMLSFAELEIIIANGSHILQPRDVIRDLVGDTVLERVPVFQHDCRDETHLYYAGETSNGTPVWLNKAIQRADLVITLGGILYHYFAGYGGGPKMLMPGIAGYETIRLNHKFTIDQQNHVFHEQCREGNLHTNPVYQDLVQVLDMVPNTLSYQIALSPQGDIVHVATGSVLDAQHEIIPHVKKMYNVPIGKKFDIVLASAGGFPADVNLIQSHKSIHHAFQAVRQDGVIVMAAECSEGIGSSTFLPYFDAGSSEHIAAKLVQNYKINGHTALSLKTKAEKANIILLSSLPDETVQRCGMIPAQNSQQAMEIALSLLLENSTGAILPKAFAQVPVSNEGKA
jgi:nickel-dependent lactate racemase